MGPIFLKFLSHYYILNLVEREKNRLPSWHFLKEKDGKNDKEEW